MTDRTPSVIVAELEAAFTSGKHDRTVLRLILELRRAIEAENSAAVEREEAR